MSYQVPDEDQIPDERMPRVIDLLKGSVDLHCHSGPSLMPRALDSAQAVEEALEIGMRALLVKDHFYAAAPLTIQLQSLFAGRGIEILSGVPLNNTSGGFNRYAVAHGLNLGARYVWMPTLSAANHIRYEQGKQDPKGTFPTPSKAMPAPVPLTVLDASGSIADEVKPILDLIAAHDAVLSSGHLHISEIFPLFEAALRHGVRRMVTNHPTYIVGASLADIAELVRMGAYIEHSIGMYVPVSIEVNRRSDELRQVIEAAGVDRTLFGSDLGQKNNGHPALGFRYIANALIDLGYSDADIRKMTSTNAANLVGLAG